MKIQRMLLMSSLGLLVSVSAFAQEPKPETGMKPMHEQMQAMNEKLDKLVLDMNSAASPEKKIDAIVGVINELVAERKAMSEHMSMMHEKKSE